MKTEEIVKALRRLKVQTGSLACMGCGLEHNCGAHGCRIIRDAASKIEKLDERCARYAEEIAVLQKRTRWIPVEERLPEGDRFWARTKFGTVVFAERRSWGDSNWLVGGLYIPRDITHWWPLPAGPEVERHVD